MKKISLPHFIRLQFLDAHLGELFTDHNFQFEFSIQTFFFAIHYTPQKGKNDTMVQQLSHSSDTLWPKVSITFEAGARAS